MLPMLACAVTDGHRIRVPDAQAGRISRLPAGRRRVVLLITSLRSIGIEVNESGACRRVNRVDLGSVVVGLIAAVYCCTTSRRLGTGSLSDSGIDSK
jgi:hypothetical protein